jgi:hypothetical protein
MTEIIQTIVAAYPGWSLIFFGVLCGLFLAVAENICTTWINREVKRTE